jgi:putative transposase
MSTSYPSNLSDAEWECLQRHLPPQSKRGRPPTHSLRAIFDAIFYVLRTGCPWRYLPTNFPPWQTVFYHFRRFRDPRHVVSAPHDFARSRTQTNWEECPAECSDHQCDIRVKTVEESAGICGFDAHKWVKGRKRHILVDTLGLLLAVYVTPADLHDGKGARCLLAGFAPLFPRLKKIWAAARVPRPGASRLVPGGGWLGSRSNRATARHAWLQRLTQTVGSGANTELDLP